MQVKSLFSLGSLAVLLVACQGYEVSVNERQVYTPLPLFTQFRVADPNLQECIDQHIEDKQITRAIQLERLNCRHAGITQLAGIETFAGLQELDLSDNALQSATELGNLSRLTWLNLANNQLTSAAPLLTLLRLTDLDLTGNADLDCTDLKQLGQVQSVRMVRPGHCAQD
ncbi:leucine-rich repeat domain-containing protein [Simiduia agarivorans]|uniref:Internalin E n=1 Tax=Simiduia agarivorans (strain DSM 21679 / JCM 13881 / BCRC 17597 / SA1) TaxID=1117647 RepID=K4KJC8_SIMAS|nr:leucine-rich repeat domain-containing protein [Simiduia agarivorans]AFU98300.1 internalin E [Simiduia agarivorans SA1 = DSM 21679]